MNFAVSQAQPVSNGILAQVVDLAGIILDLGHDRTTRRRWIDPRRHRVWIVVRDGALLYMAAKPCDVTASNEALPIQAHRLAKLTGLEAHFILAWWGRWRRCGCCEWYGYHSTPRSKTLENVLDDRLGTLGIPVLYGLPLGHGATLATLPLGVGATVDADTLTLTIDEPALLVA